MWIKPNQDIRRPGYQQILFIKSQKGDTAGAHEFVIAPDGSLAYLKNAGTSSWHTAQSAPLTWTAGRWYRVAATWGPAGMHVYRDGKHIGRAPYTGAGAYSSRFRASIGSWSYQAGSKSYRNFDGTIDEFCLSSVQSRVGACRVLPSGTTPPAQSSLAGVWSYAGIGRGVPGYARGLEITIRRTENAFVGVVSKEPSGQCYDLGRKLYRFEGGSKAAMKYRYNPARACEALASVATTWKITESKRGGKPVWRLDICPKPETGYSDCDIFTRART